MSNNVYYYAAMSGTRTRSRKRKKEKPYTTYYIVRFVIVPSERVAASGMGQRQKTPRNEMDPNFKNYFFKIFKINGVEIIVLDYAYTHPLTCIL